MVGLKFCTRPGLGTLVLQGTQVYFQSQAPGRTESKEEHRVFHDMRFSGKTHATEGLDSDCFKSASFTSSVECSPHQASRAPR